jgi:hypothetical protein
MHKLTTFIKDKFSPTTLVEILPNLTNKLDVIIINSGNYQEINVCKEYYYNEIPNYCMSTIILTEYTKIKKSEMRDENLLKNSTYRDNYVEYIKAENDLTASENFLLNSVLYDNSIKKCIKDFQKFRNRVKKELKLPVINVKN